MTVPRVVFSVKSGAVKNILWSMYAIIEIRIIRLITKYVNDIMIPVIESMTNGIYMENIKLQVRL